VITRAISRQTASLNPSFSSLGTYTDAKAKLQVKIFPSLMKRHIWDGKDTAAPRVHTFDTKWKWVISFMPWLAALMSRKSPGTHCKVEWF
jgi:hypothetical protein